MLPLPVTVLNETDTETKVATQMIEQRGRAVRSLEEIITHCSNRAHLGMLDVWVDPKR